MCFLVRIEGWDNIGDICPIVAASLMVVIVGYGKYYFTTEAFSQVGFTYLE